MLRNDKRTRIVLSILTGIFLCLGVMAGWYWYTTRHFRAPEITQNPQIGKWYRITPEGAKTSCGDDWHGMIKLGKENKVIVYFFGGGVSVDSYTAARPMGQPGGFYADYPEQDIMVQSGIAKNEKDNPFRDWTVLAVQYSNGDFHIGTGEFQYKDLKGQTQTLFHHGYTNYSLFMQEAMKYVKQPDALLVTGFSAGGFGAALLADDVVSNYFPKVDNVTVEVDSAMILNKQWPKVAKDVWKAPKEMSQKLGSDNITLDSLCALSAKYKNRVKILFDCSVRDETLQQYQCYFDKGKKECSKENSDCFQKDLKKMVRKMEQKIPNAGVYIWELPCGNDKMKMTQHMIICENDFCKNDFEQGKTVADWMMDAVNGNVRCYGEELLEKNY
ncbi:MAG: pectin acetylesterase [Lachnospiraceae bacterium]|nr:pectin acetylesterase [Lachnospiraceae bacterium]